MARDRILAIDIGTGSVRVALVGLDGRIDAMVQREHDQLTPRHGWSEQLASQWWANAEDGIVAVKRERPDLVIMDVIMPGMNGFQATRTLSRDADTSAIPILIVTTKSMETDRVWGLRQGAKDFMVKPVAESELLGRIQKLLAS